MFQFSDSISFKISLISINNVLRMTAAKKPCFDPLNSSKIEFEVVKKNPSSMEIKN